MPDVRMFTSPVPYLNEWCAEHPERSSFKSITELARFAGCSPVMMLQALDTKRRFSRAWVAGLCAGLGLVGEHAQHLANITELQYAPPEAALALRVAIWKTYAEAFGLPWDEAGSQLHEVLPADLVVVGLGPVLAALDDEVPSARRIVARSLVPLRLEPVEEALRRATSAMNDQNKRVAPRMVALPATGEGGYARRWHAYLGWAREAILRVDNDQLDYRCIVAAMDKTGMAAIEKARRRLQADLVALAQEAELSPCNRVAAVLIEVLPLTRPMRPPEQDGIMAWMRPNLDLRPIDDADNVPSNMESAASPAPATESTAAAPTSAAPETQPLPLGYLEFRVYLAIWRDWRKRNHKPSSEVYIANHTGLSPATVHDLVRRRTQISPHQVQAFLVLFGVENDEASKAALEGMSQLAAGHAPGVRGRLALTLRNMAAQRGILCTLAMEAYFVRSRWYAQAIHVLAELENFHPSTGYISRMLQGRITWKAAEEALHALAKLELLQERPDGQVVPTSPVVHTAGSLAEVTRYELYEGVFKLLRSEIAVGETDLGLSGWVVALPDKAKPRLETAKARYKSAVQDALYSAEARRKAGAVLDRVVLISHQIFPLLHLPARRRRP